MPYDLAVWKQVQVYRDCYVQFEQAYYSVPFRLVGQTVWVRGGLRTVEISDRPASGGGHPSARQCPRRAADRPGPFARREGAGAGDQPGGLPPAGGGDRAGHHQVVEELLAHRPEDRLRSAGRLVAPGAAHQPGAAGGGLCPGAGLRECRLWTIRRILDEGLEAQLPAPMLLPAPRPFTFVRGAAEFVASLMGGAR